MLVVITVGAEILLALRALYRDAEDEFSSSPFVMVVRAGNVNRWQCAVRINE